MYQRFKENDSVRRGTVLFIICLLLFIFRAALNIILLTFILTYLLLRVITSLNKATKVPKKILTIVIYGLVLIGLYFASTRYIPILFNQSISMIESVYQFYQSPKSDNAFFEWIATNFSFKEIKDQVTSGVKVLFNTITNIGSMGLTFILSFILSFFFIIEENWVKSFSQSFFSSKLGWFSQDVAYLGKKFLNTFGVVIEAQVIIALINTILTTVGLSIMHFPQLLSLALMIFILSLIPVAGVIISCIPLALIGYSIGGIQDVIYILLMIIVIHFIESYFLNPKLMSSKTNLPIFFVFVILLFSEKFFGVWGLIIGIPVFVFLLDLLEVKPVEIPIAKLPTVGKSKD